MHTFILNDVCLILQREIVSSYLDNGKPVDEQGIEDAFELLHETNERVRTGLWVGDCFIYNNSSWRLNYCVGGEVLCILVLATEFPKSRYNLFPHI
jgi:coatomer subunit beta'